MQNCEQLLTALRRRSSTISPLKLRRVSSNTPITVKSLCDWETDQVQNDFLLNLHLAKLTRLSVEILSVIVQSDLLFSDLFITII